MIVPAQSSQMPIGQEFTVNVLVHAWMVSDPKCLVRVEEALNAPLKTLPTPVSPTMVSMAVSFSKKAIAKPLMDSKFRGLFKQKISKLLK